MFMPLTKTRNVLTLLPFFNNKHTIFTKDAVTNVKPDETALTLWGDVPTDPRTALEANGFLMRRVVLTPKGSR